ncbi:exodeoxyribonuclease VII large subunit [Campylobacter sp. 19-13652]|uniref:exodeoxyribonuclease VII large subunit n=1 Tax=Campylobacter sp. 19-13652 TaxID=2840180 RepID=UPI001C76F469|nr:exodeoxyribonuclease VII large subunit [Campylobacter sp. 19-13652]BCX78826.1 exodeoxyribonuclease 7 large subunit [Campylobacter sp. 19-13652]
MLSVTQLNEQAKALLETNFGLVEVRGEISRLTRHASGHWYFVLKDEGASVSAAMFKSANLKVGFSVKEGSKVVAYAKVSMYVQSGAYQLVVSALRPDGEGELEMALNELKAKLRAQGLFEPARKKPLPVLPMRVGVVTSATSAALADMIRVASSRWGLAKLYIHDSLTQGAEAPRALISVLKSADKMGYDAIVLARGGGSKEDLWCFNDEELALTIASLHTPIITGIGHEIDESVADLVADYRASTPTAAMSALLPDAAGVAQYIDRLSDDISSAFGAKVLACKNAIARFDFNGALNLKIAKSEARLLAISSRFLPQALAARIEAKGSLVSSLASRLNGAFERKILSFEARLAGLKASFSTYESFYEATTDLIEIRSNGKKIKLEELKSGDEVVLVGQNISKKAIIKE